MGDYVQSLLAIEVIALFGSTWGMQSLSAWNVKRLAGDTLSSYARALRVPVMC